MAKKYKITFLVITALAVTSAFLPWYSHRLQDQYLIFAEGGQNDAAFQAADLAAWLDPLSVRARFTLAAAYQRLGDEQSARSALIGATQLEPLNYLPWEQLALYEIQSWGQPDLAREHFQKAIQLNPSDKELKLRARQYFNDL